MAIELRRIIKNLASLFASTIVVRGISFVATLTIARELGPTNFGQFSFGYVVFFTFSFFINFGLDNLVVRDIARTKHKMPTLLGDMFILKLWALPLGLGLALVLSATDPGAFWLFFFLASYGVLNSYLLFICAVFRGIERMEFQAMLLSLQAFLMALSAILAVLLTHQAVWVAIVYSLATAVIVVVGYRMFPRYGLRPSYQWRPVVWWQLWRMTLPFALIILGLTVFDRQTIVYITIFEGETAAGWYNAPFALTLTSETIPMMLVNTLFPLLARQAQDAPDRMKTIITQTLKYSNVISFPLALMLFAFARPIIQLLFGDAYQNSVYLLSVMSLSVIFIFLFLILANILQTMDRQQACTRILWLTLATTSPLIALATWRYGYQAGVWAHTLALGVGALALFRLLSQEVSSIDLGAIFLRPLLATAGMGAVIFLTQPWFWLFSLIVASCAYGLLLLLTGTFGQSEWHMVQQVIKRTSMPPNLPIPSPTEETIHVHLGN